MEADKAKLTLEVAQSKYGGAGVVSAFLLKHIAASAGSYAPGIQDRMFFELQRQGSDIPKVKRWLAGNVLHPDMKVEDANYTVALCSGDSGVTMVDPWPGTAPQQGPPPATLGDAHRARNYQAIAVFWRGYS